MLWAFANRNGFNLDFSQNTKVLLQIMDIGAIDMRFLKFGCMTQVLIVNKDMVANIFQVSELYGSRLASCGNAMDSGWSILNFLGPSLETGLYILYYSNKMKCCKHNQQEFFLIGTINKIHRWPIGS